MNPDVETQVKGSRRRKPLHRRRWFVVSCALALLVLLLDLVLVFGTHGSSGEVKIKRLEGLPVETPVQELTLMSVNLAHGRADGFHQMLQSKGRIRGNIEAIGDLIHEEGVHVAALQEADGPSWWSGGYSHVEHLGRHCGMSHAVEGRNVDGLGLNYGTAIISKTQIHKAQQVTFERNFPTLSKGYVCATCEWPGDDAFQFEVFSIHLDFASGSVRRRQLEDLSGRLAELGTANRPFVILGDFNTDTTSTSFRTLIEDHGLQT